MMCGLVWSWLTKLPFIQGERKLATHPDDLPCDSHCGLASYVTRSHTSGLCAVALALLANPCCHRPGIRRPDTVG